MPTYSQGSHLLKGAIGAIDPAASRRSTIVFQYNPETLQRALPPQLSGGESEQQREKLLTRHQTLAFMGVEPGESPMIDRN